MRKRMEALKLVVALCALDARVGSCNLPETSQVVFTLAGVRHRAQALSATLVRIEQEGPHGFENRSTFFARNRHWPGVPITSSSFKSDSATLATDYFSVALHAPSSSGGSAALTLLSRSGVVLWQTGSLSSVSPALSAPAFADVSVNSVLAIADAPRFVPPAEGATPAKGPVPPELQATSGFDVSNHAADVYLFMATNGYRSMRAEFLLLSGPIPALPPWAFGLWFTWYHPYTQSEKVAEIQRFIDDDIPLDVASLDRNWRAGTDLPTPSLPDEGKYIVDSARFPDMDGFLKWVHQKGMRIFFNDHPLYRTSNGTGAGSTAPEHVLDPAEIKFRWDGLTSLMERGLDFWWYDCHWRYWAPDLSIEGAGSVDGVTWGQAVYQDVTARYKSEHPSESESDRLPFGMGCYESSHPAAHRYPVWWTGDIYTTDLMQSVSDMIEAGYKTFKPYVHPDCTGHHNHTEPEVYLRWIQFCTFGTIMRVHSDPWNDRRPWTYGPEVEDIFRKYVKLRLSLVPTLASAAAEATIDGEPLVRRLDFEYPAHSEAVRMDQFLLAKDLLVAPIDPFPGGDPMRTSDFHRSRSVWIPPGEWTHAFSGLTTMGPKTVEVSNVPLDEIPVWHRRGGLLVTARSGGARVADIDWANLELHCWPTSAVDGHNVTSSRAFRQEGRRPVEFTLKQRTNHGAEGSRSGCADSGREVQVTIARADDSSTAWSLFLHLLPGEAVSCAEVDGVVAAVRSSPGFQLQTASASGLSGLTVELVLEASTSRSRTARAIITSEVLASYV